MKISLDPREIQATTIRVLLIVSAWLVAVWVVGAAQHFLFLILLAWLVGHRLGAGHPLVSPPRAEPVALDGDRRHA